MGRPSRKHARRNAPSGAAAALHDQVAAALAGSFAVFQEPEQRVRRRFLDSHDWRVWRSGACLVVDSEPGRSTLRWRRPGQPEQIVPLSGPFRLASDLPESLLRRELAETLDVRAAIPVGEADVVRRLLRLVDTSGKTVARIHIDTVQPLASVGRPADEPFEVIRIESLRGYQAAAEQACLVLAEVFDTAADEELARTAAARGRRPGDYSSRLDLSLDPQATAIEAARTILQHLLGTMQANVDGTVDDLDSEFLHDLRVAVRRSRSALGQLRGVFVPAEIEPFVRELRWLGTVTGPCRDLDVFLLELEGYRRALRLKVSEPLEPLVRHLQQARAGTQAEVADALRSRRCSRFFRHWSTYLTRTPGQADGTAAPDAHRPVLGIAGERIGRAHRRFVKRGRGISVSPAAELMHRLRIDAKKLRYLLEFFASLFPGDEAAVLVRELKNVQDCLGSFHDLHVQQLRLMGFGRDLLAASSADAETLMAMGRLTAMLEERQEDHRRAFHDLYQGFADGPARDLVASLTAGQRQG